MHVNIHIYCLNLLYFLKCKPGDNTNQVNWLLGLTSNRTTCIMKLNTKN